MGNEINPLEVTSITLGEVYRLIKDQSSDLTEIKGDIKSQYGSVANLDKRVTVLEDRGTRDTAARASGLSALLAALAALVWQWVSKP
jgi:hypothetical protein